MTEVAQRYPHLDKLSVAILEHYIEPIIGEAAIKEIKVPLVEKELRASLIGALARVEERFAQEHSDKEVAEAVLQLPLSTLPSLADAVKVFHDRPTDTTLLNIIQERLSEDMHSLSEERVTKAAETYINILKQELAASIPTAREQLVALAILNLGENTEQIAEMLDQLVDLMTPAFAKPRILGNIPPRPSLVIGRREALRELKSRLGIPTADEGRDLDTRLTVVRGWPGVGKTTIVNLLAHEPDVATAFPDGVLWAALGENPDLFSELATWGRALGVEGINQAQSIDEARTRLAAVLRNRRMLLIIDDVWETEHGTPLMLAGDQCVTLYTTRFGGVAQDLASTPDEIYVLPVLTDEKSLELLGTLTPETIQTHPNESKELVRDLEGLPLAIQVAGRLLRAETTYGWGVSDLLAEIREGAILLAAVAPADRADLVNQTTPTVAALLQKSTNRLSKEHRLHFAFLGAFAPKPATFDLEAMAAVWAVEDPRSTVRVLVDRGLLEPVGERFQMHSLLVMLSRSLLEE